MNESELIKNTDFPATTDSLRRDLGAAGVTAGMTLLVHSSLSSLGWVCGGAVAVILALEAVLGENGTLVMPTHGGGSDPATWRNPPVPESWWETIRATMPAFDPELTPTGNMGIIPETFRKQAGTVRSDHPQVSFAARGKNAKAIIDGHELAFSLGESSPLARIYQLAGWVLLLGVGHDKNTSLHLAEYRARFPGKRTEQCRAPMLVEGKRAWVEFEDLNLDETTDFPQIGEAFEQEAGLARIAKIGLATARLMPQQPLVDYAVAWMEKNRRSQ
jgi:aminoglycoside 3-N-acetyltransferase